MQHARLAFSFEKRLLECIRLHLRMESLRLTHPQFYAPLPVPHDMLAQFPGALLKVCFLGVCSMLHLARDPLLTNLLFGHFYFQVQSTIALLMKQTSLLLPQAQVQSCVCAHSGRTVIG